MEKSSVKFISDKGGIQEREPDPNAASDLSIWPVSWDWGSETEIFNFFPWNSSCPISYHTYFCLSLLLPFGQPPTFSATKYPMSDNNNQPKVN